MKPTIIGVDPSGSYNEGKGTTGIVVLDPDAVWTESIAVSAKDYNSQLAYWNGVIHTIEGLIRRASGDVAVSIEDYVLYANAAKAQINSEMETSKLIGALTIALYDYGVHIYLRSASQVKNRWNNEILIFKGYLVRDGASLRTADGQPVNRHCLDALRHALHCYHFEVGRKQGAQ